MNKSKIIDGIKELFELKRSLYESRENKRRIEMWKPGFVPDEYSPGEIAPYQASKRKEKRIPITADWDRMQWSKLLGFDISEFYRNPTEYMKWTLEIDIYRFNNFDDDTPLLKTIPIYLGTAYEPSLFGVPVNYSPLYEPLFTSGGAVIKTESDLSKLEMPNFKSSGLMPLAHKFYEDISRFAPNDYNVIFPKWGRGPFGVAAAIVGMEDLLVLLIKNPKFVHKIMRMITDARMEYTKNRRNFLKINEVDNTLWNDEASIPIISKNMYEEFCFPYEKEISNFYGGIRWWHSCGSKTPIIPIIKKIKNIGYIDLNWWTDDLMKSVKELNGEIPFDFRPSARDITERIEIAITNYLNGVFNICGNANFSIRVDGFQPANATIDDVNKMKRFLSICKEVSEKRANKEGG